MTIEKMMLTPCFTRPVSFPFWWCRHNRLHNVLWDPEIFTQVYEKIITVMTFTAGNVGIS